MRKFNAFLRYSEGTRDNGLAITALAYTNSWHSTDQIPVRAVSDGSLIRFGAVDQTDGGDTQHYSLNMRWSQSDDRGASLVEAYGIYSTLNLFNNFTYFLDNPDQGDQFQQIDKRKILGLNASHLVRHRLAGFNSETTVGTQIRYDDIGVGLFNTFQRTAYNTVRYDQVSETSLGLYLKNTTAWTDWLKMTLGVRGDLFMASVDSTTNSDQIYRWKDGTITPLVVKGQDLPGGGKHRLDDCRLLYSRRPRRRHPSCGRPPRIWRRGGVPCAAIAATRLPSECC